MTVERPEDSGNYYVFRANTLWTFAIAVLLAALSFGAPYIFGLPAQDQRITALEAGQAQVQAQLQKLNETLMQTNETLARLDERLKADQGRR